jgi:hypothetical protein
MLDHDLSHDVKFWLVVGVATLIKVLTSAIVSYKVVLVSMITGFFGGWIFTGPFLKFFELDHGIYEYPAAALIALTCEGIMRWIISLANDPMKILDVIKTWRGIK